MRSPIYWHPRVYTWTMQQLYGPNLQARWNAVLPLIRAGETVVDLCAGDGAIASLLPPGCRYLPVDANPQFTHALRRRGFDVRHTDVRTADIPQGDVVLMMGALCHFAPHHQDVVERMKKSARRAAIVIEPHVNWSAKGGFLGKLAQALSDPGIDGAWLGRLSSNDLTSLERATHAHQRLELPRETILVWNV